MISKGPRYLVRTGSVACAQNKYFLGIKNLLAGVKVLVHDIRLVNTGTGALAGVACEFNVMRTTGTLTGTAVTPAPLDTGDGALAATSVIAVHTATPGADSTVLQALWTNNDEVGAAQDLVVSALVQLKNALIAPIVVNNGEGLVVKQITNSVVGTFDVYMLIEVVRS